MTITVNFNYESIHRLANTDGIVSASPAIPRAGRLYVILNNSTARTVYVGTSSDVKARFVSRLQVIREMGFDVGSPTIFIVQIQINTVYTQPGDDGIADGIDVEHLLIRTYVKLLGLNVRNVTKWGVFRNTTTDKLIWSLNNQAGITDFGGPYRYSLEPNGSNGSSF